MRSTPGLWKAPAGRRPHGRRQGAQNRQPTAAVFSSEGRFFAGDFHSPGGDLERKARVSHSEQFLLTNSLLLNGIWIGVQLIKWAQGSSRRLGITTLTLFGSNLILFGLLLTFASHGAALQVTRALNTIVSGAGVWCFAEWAKLQPAPWGMGPRRKKTRVR